MTKTFEFEDTLLPCPFCGGTNSQIRPVNYWTGMSNTVLAVEIWHWCDNADKDEKTRYPFVSVLKIRAKTEQEAINKWNSRVGAFA